MRELGVDLSGGLVAVSRLTGMSLLSGKMKMKLGIICQGIFTKPQAAGFL